MKHWTTADAQALRNGMKKVGQSISDALAVFDMVSAKIDEAGRTVSAITGGVTKILSKSIMQLTGPANSIEGFAGQVLKVFELPSKCIDAPRQIINAYRDLAKSLIKKITADPFSIEKTKNSFALLKMSLGLCVCSSCEAVAYSISQIGSGKGKGLKTRAEAMALVEQLDEFYDEMVAVIDDATKKSVAIDGSEFSENLFKVVKLTEKAVLNAGFSLVATKTIILDRDRQMLELCAELYGDVDGKIDDFIQDNNLTIDEMTVIRSGREIVVRK